MSKIISCEQLRRLARHHAGIGEILTETLLSPDHRREREMGRLCGRWMSAPNRCGIEIVRAGEHFVLRYLKRGGRPTGERYVLVWLDGDILYYGSDDRITILALDTQTDTLMVSPGEDYTRQSENER